ncbi:MAG: hypothetical protein J2P17_01500 [Mycobacterium sp.]|nr:hypothetical protein [Mycobacterium sp.]
MSSVSFPRTSAARFRLNVPVFHTEPGRNHDPFSLGRRADSDAEVRGQREPSCAVAFEYVRESNARFTIHAGGAFGLPPIRAAVAFCGSGRLGYGVRIDDGSPVPKRAVRFDCRP